MKATAATLVAALSLVGCSGGDDGATAPLVKGGVTVPADELPTLEGAYGELPTIAFPLKPGATIPPSPSPSATDETETGDETGDATDTGDETGDETGDAADAGDGAESADGATGGASAESIDEAGEATDEATDTTPAAEATEAPADEATETPADEATDGATDEPTAEATEEPSPYIDPPSTLQVQVQPGMEGAGPAVEAENIVAVRAVAWAWGETEPSLYLNTFTQGEPLVMPVRSDVSSTLVGLSRVIVGQNVGSRVMGVIPPSVGSLASALGLDESSTVVVVVDILEQFPKDLQAQADATPTGAQVGPQINGPLGGPATVVVPSSAEPPTEISATVIATGTGPVLEDGQQALVHYSATTWAGQTDGDTWTAGRGPEAVYLTADPYGDGSQLTAWSLLVGVPVGSRVLVVTPGKEGSYFADAIVIDIVAVVANDPVVSDPSDSSTDEPADEPTGEPTGEPTDEPTGEPTDEVSSEPSQEPTGEASNEPSDSPSDDG
ncbi:MAG: PT domain-containing protein [Bifidobacteriaceae bacterium]|nr:PT domain-containing protein [Bifidobacteriaceae bacterium]